MAGLGGGATAAITDGVIIGYPYFGSSDIDPSGTYADGYDKGRTTTHEVGHFLDYAIFGVTIHPVMLMLQIAIKIIV